MSPENNELNRITGKIAELIASRKAAGKSAYLLSTLGHDLGSDRLQLQELTGGSLGTFLRAKGYTLAASGAHKNVYSIVLVEGASGAADAHQPRTRFHRRFWTAFVYPREGKARYINIDSKNFGPSKDALEAEGGTVIEIEPEYHVDDGAEDRSANVHASSERWLKAHNLSADRFVWGGKQRSVLSMVLALLNDDELRRTSLPLDVVAKLMRTTSS